MTMQPSCILQVLLTLTAKYKTGIESKMHMERLHPDRCNDLRCKQEYNGSKKLQENLSKTH